MFFCHLESVYSSLLFFSFQSCTITMKNQYHVHLRVHFICQNNALINRFCLWRLQFHLQRIFLRFRLSTNLSYLTRGSSRKASLCSSSCSSDLAALPRGCLLIVSPIIFAKSMTLWENKNKQSQKQISSCNALHLHSITLSRGYKCILKSMSPKTRKLRDSTWLNMPYGRGK